MAIIGRETGVLLRIFEDHEHFRKQPRGGNLGFLIALVVMVKEIKFKAVRHMLVYLARL